MANNIVWHYSKMEYLPSIKESGALIPKSEADVYKVTIKYGAVVSQTPFIWFSSDQNFEPLCVQLGSGLRTMNWQDLANVHGAIRFGILNTDSRLLNWKQTCSAGGANREERRSREKLAKQAKKLGSDATKWFTSLVPIPLEDLKFEMWFNNSWVDGF